MNEHFQEQLENTEPLTEEFSALLKQNRIDNDLNTDSLGGLVPGDKMLYVMVEYDKGTDDDGHRNLQLNIEKILEREIEDFEATHKFLEMAGSGSAIPRYKENNGEEIED